MSNINSTNATKFYYWQTCSKGMFKIFRFLKIVKEEHELLKECFEEQEDPKWVSVEFYSVTQFHFSHLKNVKSKQKPVVFQQRIFFIVLVCFLYSYNYMY